MKHGSSTILNARIRATSVVTNQILIVSTAQRGHQLRPPDRRLRFGLLGSRKKRRRDISGRFQGDDRQHLGALLELATHEILRAIGTRVQVDPDFDGKSPDFAVTYQGVTTVVECTVVQESDDDFNATNREDTIKKAVDSIDAGQFMLVWRHLSPGSTQPSTRQLCNDIRNWLSSLDADEEMARLRRGYSPREMEFGFGNGWNVRPGRDPSWVRRVRGGAR